MTRFAGYAAIFDRPDRGGDVVRKGAFARALEQAAEIPLLWQHKPDAVVGRIEHLSEDERGLRVIATLESNSDAKRTGRLLESGKIDGLSFGYRVREAKSDGALRELIERSHTLQSKVRRLDATIHNKLTEMSAPSINPVEHQLGLLKAAFEAEQA